LVWSQLPDEPIHEEHDRHDRHEAAALLRRLADDLDGGDTSSRSVTPNSRSTCR
jgi:hypothetical protein